MQASRASSRALKAIAAGSKQTRSLHMTGPATFSSLLTSDRPALNLPNNLAGLRSECLQRKLPTFGTKEELVSRLTAHEVANSRGFSTTTQDTQRPTPTSNTSGKPVRHFNTSRSLKAVKDSSTIDFAYIPDFDPDANSAPVEIRVPILPQNSSASMYQFGAKEEPVQEVLEPTIYTVSANGTHIHTPAAMNDVTDSNQIDFNGLASKVASKASQSVEEGAGMARQIWGGLMDDIMGPKGQGGARA